MYSLRLSILMYLIIKRGGRLNIYLLHLNNTFLCKKLWFCEKKKWHNKMGWKYNF